MSKWISSALFILCLANQSWAQIGYYISRQISLPDTALFLSATDLPVSSNREDVKSIGMGKAFTSCQYSFNSMMYNPASLSSNRFSLDILNLQLSLPPKTFDAASYIKGHISDFREALSLKEIWSGVNDFKTARSANDQLNALRRIQNGMRFPRDLLNKVIGGSQSPWMHGLKIIPSFSMQLGNLGLTLYGISQSGFQMQQSPIIDALLEVQLPNDINNPLELSRAIFSLEGPLSSIIDAAGNFNINAYPVAYAFSYIDVVGAAGYGFDLGEGLSAGMNVKVIHRRFATQRIIVDHFEDLFSEIRKGLNYYATGVSFDVGAIYKFPFGSRAGISIQNLLPIKKVKSTMKANIPISYLDYDRDQFGRLIIRNNDTALVNYSRNVQINLPFRLTLPLLVNIGFSHDFFSGWHVALDIADVFEQDKKMDKYTQRIRFGTEYTFDAIENSLGITPRIGFSDDNFAFGLGLNLFRVIQLDGAYSFDNYVDARSYFAQLRIGW